MPSINGFSAGLLTLALVVLAACGDDTQKPPTATGAAVRSTPAATSTVTSEKTSPAAPVVGTPTPTYRSHARGTRTGDTRVDAVLAALEERDAASLASLMEETSIPCRAPLPMNPQPDRCPKGAPVGSPITGVWFAHGEGGLRSVEFAVDRVLESEPEVFAVARVDGTSSCSSCGDTAIFFWGKWNPGKVAGKLALQDGRIIAVAFGDWDPNYSSLPGQFRDWLLPPAH